MRTSNHLAAALLFGGLILASLPAGAGQVPGIGPQSFTTQPAGPAGFDVAAAGQNTLPAIPAAGAASYREGCTPLPRGEWTGYDIWNAVICPVDGPGGSGQ